MATKLERFIQKNRIRPAQLAKAAGVSRNRLHAVRVGQGSPRLDFMRKVAFGCQALLQRRVAIDDLFDLEPSPLRKAS